MPSLVQIVPYFPPQVSGIGDYSVLLAEQLRLAHDVHTHFIVANPSWSGPDHLNGFPVSGLKTRTGAELLAALNRSDNPASSILLHYAGYGYQKRGCPFWLAKALAENRKRVGGSSSSGHKLVTMFHELFAFGPPSSSAFWTSLLQRWIAARINRLSDIRFTNRKNSARQLENWEPRRSDAIRVFPVFSNFGELSPPPPLIQRPPDAIFFGGFGRQIKDPSAGLSMIARACKFLGVERIHVLGGAVDAAALAPLAVQSLKSLPASAASRLLSECRVGFLDYFDGYLGKSSFFASFCGHGLAPILAAPNSSEADGLSAGKNFLVASDITEPVSISRQQQIATAARDWYLPHNLSKMAQAIANDVDGHQIKPAQGVQYAI